jgi:hypothetical protein
MPFYHEFEDVADWRLPGLYLEREHAVEAEVLLCPDDQQQRQHGFPLHARDVEARAPRMGP